MGPESNNFYYALVFEDLIHQSVPYVKAARVSAGKISNQLFVRRGFWNGSNRRISRSSSALCFSLAAASFFASFCACLVKTTVQVAGITIGVQLHTLLPE